ncbi:elongin A, like [Pholidichthys leucotaenia]
MSCSGSEVAKKVTRLKLQLSGTAEPARVVKILQKLKELDISLNILAETGIGKTVNSLRRHDEAGELARSLVRGWKKLVPKQSTSHKQDDDLSDNDSVKERTINQGCSNNGSMAEQDDNNNGLTSPSQSQDSSDEAPAKMVKVDREKSSHKRGRKLNKIKKYGENLHVLEQKSKMETSDAFRKKANCSSKSGNGEMLLGNRNAEESHQKSQRKFEEKFKGSSNCAGIDPSMQSKESECESKWSKMLKLQKNDGSLEIQRGSDGKKRKGKKASKEKCGTTSETENTKHSKHKKAKTKDKEGDSEHEEPSMSFESYLNYDVGDLKRKGRSRVKKPLKKIRTDVKELKAKSDGTKNIQSSNSAPKQFQDSLMHVMNVPLPATLPECEKPSSYDYFERKVEKEPDFCDISEESAVFTGQRLNTKMQVYSGAKSAFLPTMLSLYQQCIRTLQNNINLLYETGGVPFEILEPVLERCTPEQLLRIEDCNPIYIGVTDHLWGKHCQRDFKDCRLQEYESWKEMYIRLSEERERKLLRLTKTIVSAHSKKSKGRQVKMAFIHTVAKPPRDVRIQQEIHGTASQQPHQVKSSVKVQENQLRQSCTEPTRSSNTSLGRSNTHNARKKTRVAPMMAKSLKAFKKRLGHR